MEQNTNSIVHLQKLCWEQYAGLDSTESNSAMNRDSRVRIRSYSMANRSTRVRCSRHKQRTITSSPLRDSASIQNKAGARPMVCIHCKKHLSNRARSNADIAHQRKFWQQNLYWKRIRIQVKIRCAKRSQVCCVAAQVISNQYKPF